MICFLLPYWQTFLEDACVGKCIALDPVFKCMLSIQKLFIFENQVYGVKQEERHVIYFHKLKASTWKIEKGGSGIHGYFQLPSKF